MTINPGSVYRLESRPATISPWRATHLSFDCALARSAQDDDASHVWHRLLVVAGFANTAIVDAQERTVEVTAAAFGCAWLGHGR